MTIPVSGFIWVINVTVWRDSSMPTASLRQPACKMAKWEDIAGYRLWVGDNGTLLSIEKGLWSLRVTERYMSSRPSHLEFQNDLCYGNLCSHQFLSSTTVKPLTKPTWDSENLMLTWASQATPPTDYLSIYTRDNVVTQIPNHCILLNL